MHKKGFTIVELLIVIVVIAILAAISIVAYTGIQKRAHISSMKADVRNFEQAIEIYKVREGHWPMCPGKESLNYSECTLHALLPVLDQESLNMDVWTYDKERKISYVVTNNTGRWALRMRIDGKYCKIGRNMISTWYSNAPLCW